MPARNGIAGIHILRLLPLLGRAGPAYREEDTVPSSAALAILRVLEPVG